MLTDWINLAIKMEEKGLAFYTECYKQSGDNGSEQLFQFLVSEESLHFKTLTTLKKTMSKPFATKKEITKFNAIKSRMPIFNKTEISKTLKKDLSGKLNRAMEFENQGHVFYCNLASKETDKEVKKFLQRLARMEKDHKDAITKFGKSLLGI